MTSRSNPENFSTRAQKKAEDISSKSEQSNLSTAFTLPNRDQKGDTASSGEDLSRQESETWDPLLNSKGVNDDRRESTSSRYSFTHDQLAHPDE